MLSCTQEDHENGRYMRNRELSWLQFNERCMRQAKDSSNPLLERLRFLSIFTSNLDEFFMVRVGSLIDMLPLGKKYTDDKTGETAEEQLTKIYDRVRILYAQRDAIYQELEKEFRIKGVFRLKYEEMTASEQEYVENYFSNSILPMLSRCWWIPSILSRTSATRALKSACDCGKRRAKNTLPSCRCRWTCRRSCTCRVRGFGTSAWKTCF